MGIGQTLITKNKVWRCSAQGQNIRVGNKKTEIDAYDSSLAVLYQFYFETGMGFIRSSTGERVFLAV